MKKLNRRDFLQKTSLSVATLAASQVISAKDLLGNDMIVLWTAGDAAGNQYTLTIVPKTDDGEISLQDADVLALLGSLTGK